MAEEFNQGKQIILIELFTTGLNAQRWQIEFASVEYLYFIEDIFSFCVTGKMKFYDRIGLMEFGPINGSEKIKVTFGNTNDEKDYRTITFDIFKILKVEGTKGEHETSDLSVEVLLVDESYTKWHYRQWSSGWNETNGGVIAQEVASKQLGVTFHKFEPVNETLTQFDTHLSSPAESLSWLMRRISGKATGTAGYLCYQNNENPKQFGWNFVTLEHLLSNQKFMEPFDESKQALYAFSGVAPEYVNFIMKHEVYPVDFTALRTLSGGILLGYDPLKKKFLKREYSYADALKRYTVLGGFSLFSDEAMAEKINVEVDGATDEVTLDNVFYSGWIKDYCNQQLVAFTVPGCEKRYAGGMIRVVWPTSKKPHYDFVPDVYNKQMDGKYLVKSVTHYFDKTLPNGWVQKLTCIKNGYKDSPNPKLVRASKVNL